MNDTVCGTCEHGMYLHPLGRCLVARCGCVDGCRPPADASLSEAPSDFDSLLEHHQATERALENAQRKLTADEPRCDCGAVMTQCTSCAIADYQAAAIADASLLGRTTERAGFTNDATTELLAALDELYPLPDDGKRAERAGRTAMVVKRWMASTMNEIEQQLIPVLLAKARTTHQPPSGRTEPAEAPPASYADHRAPDIPQDSLQGAFVCGAKWWEWQSTGGTMWASDRDKAWAEAEKRYPDATAALLGAPAPQRTTDEEDEGSQR